MTFRAEFLCGMAARTFLSFGRRNRPVRVAKIQIVDFFQREALATVNRKQARGAGRRKVTSAIELCRKADVRVTVLTRFCSVTGLARLLIHPGDLFVLAHEVGSVVIPRA